MTKGINEKEETKNKNKKGSDQVTKRRKNERKIKKRKCSGYHETGKEEKKKAKRKVTRNRKINRKNKREKREASEEKWKRIRTFSCIIRPVSNESSENERVRVDHKTRVTSQPPSIHVQLQTTAGISETIEVFSME